uniref:DNA-directed RNA polymerase n=1 Tax=viral metagenome TaxID=1070528 RepID=A0A6C0K5B7_9ZZZZ
MEVADDVEDFGVDDVGGFDDLDAVVVTTEPTTSGNAGDPMEILYRHHPEAILDYAEKVSPYIPLQQVPPSSDGKDPVHKTQPFLSVYERTKILGFRANQLAQGAPPYIARPEHVTNVHEIAKMELEQRRLPYIIKRPLPNGTFEYWRLSDMMMI